MCDSITQYLYRNIHVMPHSEISNSIRDLHSSCLLAFFYHTIIEIGYMLVRDNHHSDITPIVRSFVNNVEMYIMA